MVAWRLKVFTPEYRSGREIIVIANDITYMIGSFGPREDQLFLAASQMARSLKIPRIYVAANSGQSCSLLILNFFSFQLNSLYWKKPTFSHEKRLKLDQFRPYNNILTISPLKTGHFDTFWALKYLNRDKFCPYNNIWTIFPLKNWQFWPEKYLNRDKFGLFLYLKNWTILTWKQKYQNVVIKNKLLTL